MGVFGSAPSCPVLELRVLIFPQWKRCEELVVREKIWGRSECDASEGKEAVFFGGPPPTICLEAAATAPKLALSLKFPGCRRRRCRKLTLLLPLPTPPLSPYLSPPSASPSKNTPPPSRSRLRRSRHLPRPRPLRRPQARAPRPVWPALGLRHRRLLPAHGRGRTPRPHALGHVLHRRARVRRHGLRVLPGRAGPARWA